MGTRGFDTLTGPMPDMPVLALLIGDVIRLKRPHPCGGDTWLLDRVGADIGLRCQTCGRHVLVARRLVERRLVEFIARGDPLLTAALAPPFRDPRP
jgi:hypothetical protein